jgi:integrase
VIILGRRGKVTALRGDAADAWKLCWTADQTKNGKEQKVALHGEAREIVERAWANEVPGCAHLFHVDGKPLGRMRSEVQRTCSPLGIAYGRGKGIV